MVRVHQVYCSFIDWGMYVISCVYCVYCYMFKHDSRYIVYCVLNTLLNTVMYSLKLLNTFETLLNTVMYSLKLLNTFETLLNTVMYTIEYCNLLFETLLNTVIYSLKVSILNNIMRLFIHIGIRCEYAAEFIAKAEGCVSELVESKDKCKTDFDLIRKNFLLRSSSSEPWEEVVLMFSRFVDAVVAVLGK
ncbi:hypothetical protein AAMO2058_001197200 [Amorphochlora amoebiformis]